MDITSKSMDEVNTTSRSSGSLQDRVEAALPSLSRSEAKIAQYLISMPTEQLIFASSDKLGKATHTSDATVIRTARKLGYNGLPDLKRDAGQSLRSNSPQDKLAIQLAGISADVDEMSEHIFADAHEALELTSEALNTSSLRSAIELLANATSVFCYGYGGSELAAQHLTRRLNRLGYDVRCANQTGILLADELLQLRHGDVAVVFQPGRQLNEIDVIFEHAAAVGAGRVLVAGKTLAEQLRDSVDVALTCAWTTIGMSAEALPTLAIADTLAYGMSSLNESQATRSRAQLTHLRQQLVESTSQNRTSRPT